MDHPSPHLYRAQGVRLGIPEDVLERAISQTARNEEQRAGAILSLRHLAQLSGAPYLYLRKIVQRTIDPYAAIAIKKRGGGTRMLSAPEPILMDVQRLILRRALRSIESHPRSFAYQNNRSIVDCARLHVGAHWLIKLDLHDFFGSISEKRAYEVFNRQGYSNLVSFELARLCTRAGLRWAPPPPSADKYRAIPSYSTGNIGSLPQGGPTSGAIANAVATPLDHGLHTLADSAGLTYTRYSDDLTFSGASRFKRSDAAAFIRRVGPIVSSNGLLLHHRKTRVVPPGARHVVLGLLVDEHGVRLLPEFRRRVEVHVRGVRKFGLTAHVASRGFKSIFSFVNHVDGCLAFGASVDPDWADRTRAEWLDALIDNSFPIDRHF
ncbi:MAG TPA: reverse transcriptase family protein [Kribbella sp.]